MPKVELNEPEVDTGFEQMGGVRMSERVDARPGLVMEARRLA